jgi:conjugal transfer pilus assembly protein TraU
MYAFPLLYMMDLFVDGLCFSDGYLDLDLMFMSELDPTWSEDELSFFFFVESAAVANPIAIAACGIDMAAASADRPIDSMFWCAGGWGHLYPMSGHHDASGSLAENTSLLASRALAIAHRRGFAHRTKGDDALCGGVIDPMFPKSQYRMSMFFPVTEAGVTTITRETSVTEPSGGGAQGPNQSNDKKKEIKSPGSHVIGASTFLWGEWRSIPGIGEDAMYVVYRWVDCCMGILGGDH